MIEKAKELINDWDIQQWKITNAGTKALN